jgi:hypothetical protein
MSVSTFQKKHQRYSAFYASGEYEPVYKEFPLILTITPTLDRALALRNAIYGIDNTDMQWLFASKEDIEKNPLGNVWYGKEKEPVSLI